MGKKLRSRPAGHVVCSVTNVASAAVNTPGAGETHTEGSITCEKERIPPT
jgi:hypothetical protein